MHWNTTPKNLPLHLLWQTLNESAHENVNTFALQSGQDKSPSLAPSLRGVFVNCSGKTVFAPWKHILNESKTTFATFLQPPFSDKVPKPKHTRWLLADANYIQNAHGCNAMALCLFRHVERAMKQQLNVLDMIKSVREQKEMLSGATCFEIAPVTVTLEEQLSWNRLNSSLDTWPHITEHVLCYVLQAINSSHVCLNTAEWSFPKERLYFVIDYFLLAYSEKTATYKLQRQAMNRRCSKKIKN